MAKKTQKALVGIVMGSDSDLPTMMETAQVLDRLAVAYEMEIASAHRSPDRAAEYARTAAKRGLQVIIAGAGGAFHLAGIVAAHTVLPVIAVPLANSPLSGLDALLAAVQMPGGIPVAVMAVGKAGAVNAAILGAQILATANPALRQRLVDFKQNLAREVDQKNVRLQQEMRK